MSDITILEEIRLLASELSNMSPKTQLEIVKLCKNICLKTKDYLDGVVEDIEDETTRATAKENEIASNLSNEITRATAKENQLQTDLSNEITRAVNSENSINSALTQEISRATLKENEINTKVNNEITRATAKDNQLQTDLTNIQNKIGFITLEEGITTITNEQLAECYKPNCIIKYNTLNSGSKYFLKNSETNVSSVSNAQFKFYRIDIDNNGTYITIYQDEITINQISMTYTLYNDSYATYKKYAIDNELNNKQNTLEFNPTIPSGTTPTPLSNLKDGNNYYSLSGGGGGNKYLHSIAFQTSDSNMIMGLVNVLSDKSTTLSVNDLFNSAFLYSGVAVTYDSEYYPVFINIDSSQNIIMVTGLIRNSDNVIYLNTSIPKADITIAQDTIKSF